jgi:hypothetical protein
MSPDTISVSREISIQRGHRDLHDLGYIFSRDAIIEKLTRCVEL